MFDYVRGRKQKIPCDYLDPYMDLYEKQLGKKIVGNKKLMQLEMMWN